MSCLQEYLKLKKSAQPGWGEKAPSYLVNSVSPGILIMRICAGPTVVF